MTSGLTGDTLALARRILLETIELLDTLGIPYHLEGGTLLGIVRDGDLLPWDKDVDISIPAAAAARFRAEAVWGLRRKGWRVAVRRMEAPGAAWNAGDIRLFKVRPRKLLFFGGEPCLDVFVKHPGQGFDWWIAEDKVMRVATGFYDGFDAVAYQGRQLRAPRNHHAYLEAKYGNWRVPVRDWLCSRDERTIVPDS